MLRVQEIYVIEIEELGWTLPAIDTRLHNLYNPIITMSAQERLRSSLWKSISPNINRAVCGFDKAGEGVISVTQLLG